MNQRTLALVWPAVVAGVVCLWTARSPAQTALPVVPGAAGFGMETRAAYACGTAPAILRVTNLADSGSGSLRDALSASVPRVIVFETSGTIELSSDIDVLSPCLTVAGQTAPSPGVTLRNGGINVYARDVLVQHLRIRPGDGGERLPQTAAHNGLLVYEAFGYRPYNVVYDHVSVSWAGGKNLNLFTSSSNSVTIWRSIISEALYYAANVIVSEGQPSSLGALIEGARVSIVQSLFAHNSDRNPEIHERSELQFVNNVVYDWGKDVHPYSWAMLFYAPGEGAWRASVVGNKYIAGPPPHPTVPLYAVGTWSGSPGSALYMHDNATDSSRQTVLSYHNHLPFDPRVSSPPVPLGGLQVHASSDVESLVLANAGARPADRDAVDERVVNQVANRTGTVISSQYEVGGWPDLAVNRRSLSVPANPHAVDGTGYTALERWLHEYAAQVEGGGAPGPSYAPAPPSNVRFLSASR